MHDGATTTEPVFEVDLQIDGMTCASCAARIEKRLNELEGVEATVNFATEEAKVRATSPVAVDDLVAAVEAAGYRAHAPRPSDRRDSTARRRTTTTTAWTTLVGVSSCRRSCPLPVIALGMFPVPPVRQLAVVVAHTRRPGGDVGCLAVPPGGVGQPAPRARRRWTRWSPSACWPPSVGRCTPCSSATPANRACATGSA